jgi:hypothetical protein
MSEQDDLAALIEQLYTDYLTDYMSVFGFVYIPNAHDQFVRGFDNGRLGYREISINDAYDSGWLEGKIYAATHNSKL